MTIPVFVTAPATLWDKTAFGGATPMSDKPVFGDMVVGIIAGADAKDLESKERIERDLGLKINTLVRELKCADGKIAVSIAPAVRCEAIEQAMALPGFTHLFLFSGITEVLPE